jgi:oligoribonuclease NrnB/cAMP/cGMP phosphodiesterase (DHH superfamily)
MTLCIYHGNCADGFGAAWALRKALGESVEFHAGTYQDPPPDVNAKDVVLVDFSYKRDVLRDMARTANSILVLDHHKSAAEDLYDDHRTDNGPPVWRADGWAELDSPWEHFRTCAAMDQNEGATFATVYACFDMNRSGAGLAWDFFHPRQPRPQLLNHIEDRDLWRFALARTREIQANVFSHPYNFQVWDELMRANLDDLAKEGEAIERKHFKDIEELTGVVTRRMVIGGYNVPIANLPYTLVSDAGHKLAKGEPFAGCYWDTPAGRVFGLRSTDDGVDVSEIAKQYGGGGHRNAAGFRVGFDKAVMLEIANA